jgi:hypothetical protein
MRLAQSGNTGIRFRTEVLRVPAQGVPVSHRQAFFTKSAGDQIFRPSGALFSPCFKYDGERDAHAHGLCIIEQLRFDCGAMFLMGGLRPCVEQGARSMTESKISVEFSCLNCGQRAEVHNIPPTHLLTILGGIVGEVCRHQLTGQRISSCPTMQKAERRALQLLNHG